jgi:hypothetical protein
MHRECWWGNFLEDVKFEEDGFPRITLWCCELNDIASLWVPLVNTVSSGYATIKLVANSGMNNVIVEDLAEKRES